MSQPVQDGDVERAEKVEPVTWLSLPRKGQLALLTVARLSEPLLQTSLQSYMFYQLRSFDPSLTDPQIAQQAGILHGSFMGAQFLTSMIWGMIADSKHIGRKNVVMISLFSTGISAVGFGFSKSFAQALTFRMLGGLMNGNIGVMRTMVSEIIKEKRFQSRAFLLLPLTFNVGVIVGPLLGGSLADPVAQYPGLFGPNSTLGGEHGVSWMLKWPYALPNLVSAVFLIISTFAIFVGLQETHEDRPPDDVGRYFGKWVQRVVLRKSETAGYRALAGDEDAVQGVSSSVELLDSPVATPTSQAAPIENFPESTKKSVRQRLPWQRIWTRNVIVTMIAHAFLTMHIGTFNSLCFIFLSAPRFDPAHPHPSWMKEQKLPFNFAGGLGLPPFMIGLSLTIVGIFGIIVQFAVYPRVTARLSTIWTYRYCLVFFPVAYVLAPYLAVVPSQAPPPHHVTGALVWISFSAVIAIHVTGRTFALPAAQILVNNNCPHPSRLGTMHGIGQSVSSGMRTIGPIAFAWIFGKGLELGVVGLAYWTLAVFAAIGAIAALFVNEGNGHEIVLAGEEVEVA